MCTHDSANEWSLNKIRKQWWSRNLVFLPPPPLSHLSLCNFVIRTVGNLPFNEAALLPQLKEKQFNHTAPQEKLHIKAATAAEARARANQVRERGKHLSVVHRVQPDLRGQQLLVITEYFCWLTFQLRFWEEGWLSRGTEWRVVTQAS